MPLRPSDPHAPPSLGSFAGQTQKFLRLVHFSLLLQRFDCLTQSLPKGLKSNVRHSDHRVRGEVLKNVCQIPPGRHGLFVMFPMTCSASAGYPPDLQKTQKTARGPSSSGNHNKDTTMLNMLQVAGCELLTEEFFSLFELLHGLQQVSQVVDGRHGIRVLVPQLEAASVQV